MTFVDLKRARDVDGHVDLERDDGDVDLPASGVDWIGSDEYSRLTVARAMKVVGRVACCTAFWCLLACAKKAAPVESLATSSASASSTTASGFDLKQTCTEICERSQVLKCARADECLMNCVASASGTPCNSEFKAFYGCIVKEPLKGWECADDGVAAIREGLCDKEQERAIACMQAKAAR